MTDTDEKPVPKPGRYDPVPLRPEDRPALGEPPHVLRKENRRRVLGSQEFAEGHDFDPHTGE